MKVSPAPYNSLHVDVYQHGGEQPHATVSAFIPGCQLFIHNWPAPKLIEAAKGFVDAANELDPDNFDALWMGLVASIRAARMPQMTITVDPAQTYRHGLVPTCDEDVNLDVCNYQDDAR